jgi:hypothetical protein
LYRTTSTARNSFGDAVVEVIDKIIDLAPLPQLARTCAACGNPHRRPRGRLSVGIFLRLIINSIEEHFHRLR